MPDDGEGIRPRPDLSRRGEKGVVRALRGDGLFNEGLSEIDTPPGVRESLAILTDACGRNLVGVIFFGSLLLDTSPDADSAADLFVIVEDYRSFYQDIGSRLPAARRASIMAALNRVLPPNIIYIGDPGDLRAGAKCFIIDERDLAACLSTSSRDYFCRGRLTQRVQTVYARSPEDRMVLEELLEGARRSAVDWVPIYLGETFSAKEFCFRMLEVSFAGEIRPESRARVREVFSAQETYFRLMYGRILEEAVAEEKLRRVDGQYALIERPVFSTRIRWRLFFHKSRVRATLRWGKYMLTFDDWLDYITRKVERRTGVHTELTQSQRRLPALLLWPKAIRVLRAARSRNRAKRKSTRQAENRRAQ
jgi:hypothetical protein